MSYTYDFHSHSTASDGTLTPTALVGRASTLGLDAIALTDHDTVDGLAEAAAKSQEADILLVPGVELSVSWNKVAIHILGLGINPSYAPLVAGMEKMRNFRDWRAEEMARRLAKKGINGCLQAAQELCRGRIISRTHFARVLVEQGHAKNFGEAIRKYLKRGKAGYVPGQWAAIDEVLAWIKGAGGIAVLAHPLRYELSASRRRMLFAEFAELDGDAIEVVNATNKPEESQHLALVAAKQGFYASQGSDFHSPDNPWVELGRFSKLPDGCRALWQHERLAAFLELKQIDEGPLRQSNT